MVLGIYYITYGKAAEDLAELEEALKSGKWKDANGTRPRAFRSAQEAELAFENDLVKLHDLAEFRRAEDEHFLTTVGRIIFNDRIERALADALEEDWDPAGFEFVNRLAQEARRQRHGREVGRGLRGFGGLTGARRLQGPRVPLRERRPGSPISKNDVITPPDKEKILERTRTGGEDPVDQYDQG